MFDTPPPPEAETSFRHLRNPKSITCESYGRVRLDSLDIITDADVHGIPSRCFQSPVLLFLWYGTVEEEHLAFAQNTPSRCCTLHAHVLKHIQLVEEFQLFAQARQEDEDAVAGPSYPRHKLSHEGVEAILDLGRHFIPTAKTALLGVVEVRKNLLGLAPLP